MEIGVKIIFQMSSKFEMFVAAQGKIQLASYKSSQD